MFKTFLAATARLVLTAAIAVSIALAAFDVLVILLTAAPLATAAMLLIYLTVAGLVLGDLCRR